MYEVPPYVCFEHYRTNGNIFSYRMVLGFVKSSWPEILLKYILLSLLYVKWKDNNKLLTLNWTVWNCHIMIVAYKKFFVEEKIDCDLTSVVRMIMSLKLTGKS